MSPILTSCFRATVLLIAVGLVRTSIAQDVNDPVRIKHRSSSAAIQAYIKQLNHDSYRTRENAKRKLIQLGRDSAQCSAVESALRGLANDKSLEVRDAARRIANVLCDMRFREQVEQLTLPNSDPDTIELPGWKTYSAIAGTDLVARRLFKKMLDQQLDWLRLMDQFASESQSTRPDQVVVDSLNRYLDPYQVAPDDRTHWVLMFCFESLQLKSSLPNLSNRLSLSLSQAGIGPKLDTEADALVLQKLIGRWVERRQFGDSNRERLMIAMRYECYSQAFDVCDQVFQDPIASPSEITLALLCAAMMQKDGVQQQILMHIDDERTAYVTQMVASRKRKIRTQVRDVAMALLLRSRRIDPREVGFSQLQADPLFIYREHSLGFPDNESRQKAYQAAAMAMQD